MRPKACVVGAYLGRASKDLCGNKFYGCWTCVEFDVESMRCAPSYQDYRKGVKLINNISDYIENPAWYRCTFWENGE